MPQIDAERQTYLCPSHWLNPPTPTSFQFSRDLTLIQPMEWREIYCNAPVIYQQQLATNLVSETNPGFVHVHLFLKRVFWSMTGTFRSWWEIVRCDPGVSLITGGSFTPERCLRRYSNPVRTAIPVYCPRGANQRFFWYWLMIWLVQLFVQAATYP